MRQFSDAYSFSVLAEGFPSFAESTKSMKLFVILSAEQRCPTQVSSLVGLTQEKKT